MWEWVEIWKDGKEVTFGPFPSAKETSERCAFNQMDWAEDVIDHITIRRVKE
jgi:hypothetical protein